MKIWTNGTFDILHPGHIELFKYAKSLGNELYVGIDYDVRVTELKGSDRPINSWYDRATIVESIRYVDRVFGFGSDDQLEKLIRILKPDAIVVGGDYKGKKVLGCDLVDKVHYFNRLETYSTTKIIERWKIIKKGRN